VDGGQGVGVGVGVGLGCAWRAKANGATGVDWAGSSSRVSEAGVVTKSKSLERESHGAGSAAASTDHRRRHEQQVA
jgi:hypothetical protein